MRETKIYCDHCGKVLDCMNDYDDIVIDWKKDCLYTDLCTECLDDLGKIITTFCSGLKFKQSRE
jgi:hypothetical protein